MGCMVVALGYCASYLLWRRGHFVTSREYISCPCYGGTGPGVLYVSVNEPGWIRQVFAPMLWCDERITHLSAISE